MDKFVTNKYNWSKSWHFFGILSAGVIPQYTRALKCHNKRSALSYLQNVSVRTWFSVNIEHSNPLWATVKICGNINKSGTITS